jgi:hypothetical protein
MTDETAPSAPDTPYAEDGVDLTMIRWMLSLTPQQRLDVLQGFVNAVERIRAQQSGK